MTKEEKEKLIELSDLNREDNVKYISSEAQGIAITLDSDRYAPTLCKLERAYICGRRKSENRITELEKENAELKEVHESDKRSLRLIAEKGAELEKKISILLSCKNCPENKGGYICEKEYEEKCLSQKIQYIKELQEEIAELKDYRLKTLAKNQTDVQKYAVNLEHKLSWYDEQLLKAKEIIEKYRQAVDKCLHITFMGGGCEVNTIGQYATLVDGYLTDVEGLAKWKN